MTSKLRVVKSKLEGFQCRLAQRNQKFCGGVIFLISLICLSTVGYSAWKYFNNDSVSTSDSGGISVAPASEETPATDTDYVDLAIEGKFDASSGTNTYLNDGVQAKLSWTKSSALEAFPSSDLNDYFYLYDQNARAGENSPYLSFGQRQSKMRFENYRLKTDSLSCYLNYEPGDIIDKTHTSWTSSEKSSCLEDINSSSYFTSTPRGVTDSSQSQYYTPVVTELTSPSGYSYLKLYCSCWAYVDTSLTTDEYVCYDYRVHAFYYVKGINGTHLARADSHFNQEAFIDGDTGLSSVYGLTPTISIASDYVNLANSSYFTYWLYLKTDITPATSGNTVYYDLLSSDAPSQLEMSDSTFASYSFTGRTLTLKENGFTNTDAGYNYRYGVVDKERDFTADDATRDALCESFISQYLSTKVSSSTATSYSKISSSNIGFINDATATVFPYFGYYQSKEAYGSSYAYRFYFFYYILGSDQLMVSFVDTRYTSNVSSIEDEPYLCLYPMSNQTDRSAIFDYSNQLSYLCYRASTSYGSSLYLDSGKQTSYLGEPRYAYADAIDTSFAFDSNNCDPDALKRQIMSKDTAIGEVISEDDAAYSDRFVKGSGSEFNFLKLFISKKTISETSYQYRLWCVSHMLGGYSLVLSGSGNVSSTSAEYPSFTINSASASTNPSYLGLDHINQSYLYYVSSTGSSDKLTLGSYSQNYGRPGYVVNDYLESEETAIKNIKYRSLYIQESSKALYDPLDENKPHAFSCQYLDNGEDYGSCLKSQGYYFYPSANNLNISKIDNFYTYSNAYDSDPLLQGHYYSTSAPDANRSYLMEGTSTLSSISLYQLCENSPQLVRQTMSDGECYVYQVGGRKRKAYAKDFIGDSFYETNFTLHVRLYPKSDAVKESMHTIVKSFKFALSLSVVEIDAWSF